MCRKRYLTKVFVRGHPANRLGGDNRQQSRAEKGANPREEEEKTHDGTLHGLGGCRVRKLQTWNEMTVVSLEDLNSTGEMMDYIEHYCQFSSAASTDSF